MLNFWWAVVCHALDLSKILHVAVAVAAIVASTTRGLLNVAPWFLLVLQLVHTCTISLSSVMHERVE